MKVVIDTNVFISGIFWSGPPSKILDAWRDEEIDVALSPEILDEYRRVGAILAAKMRSVDLHSLSDLHAMKAAFVAVPSSRKKLCDDPDDDKFIFCALAAGAGVIVSGDNHLLHVSGRFGVKVMSPRAFQKNTRTRPGFCVRESLSFQKIHPFCDQTRPARGDFHRRWRISADVTAWHKFLL